MNKDALRKFYENVLPVVGLDIGSDDFLYTYSIDKSNEKEPIVMMVNNLPVIFPTDSVLREGKWNDRIGFHPLSESVTRGISPVLLSMATTMKFKMIQAVFHIGLALLNVTKESREGNIKNLPAKLVESLGTLPKTVDAKTITFFSKIFAGYNDTDKAIMKICIKRNGSILGTDYKRTTAFYFPIYDQLCEAIDEKKTEFWGINAQRKSDLVVIKELLEIILPDIDDENRYAAGTFVSTAPYLDSFIRAGVKVQESLNNAMEMLDKHISSTLRSHLYAATEWVEELEDLKDLRNVVPPLRFNEGEITEEEQRAREADTRKVEPKRIEKSADIPDFNAKGTNSVKRASEVNASTGGGYGRRYIDNSLTDEERRNPELAERRMSSDYDDRDDRRDYRDRHRDDRRVSEWRSRDRDRGYHRDDRRDDRGRGYRGPTSWADRRNGRGR